MASCNIIFGYKLSESELTYDIHPDCITNAIDNLYLDEENAQSFCSGGADSFGDTIENYIEDDRAAYLADEGIISNLGYIYHGSCTSDVVIPETINTTTVTTIGEGAFSYNQLTSVVIPDSVTSIGDYAFQNNQLTRVEIPDSVETIGDYAFSSNHLAEVYIGSNSNLTSIGYVSFGDQHNELTIYNNSGKAFDWNYVVNGTIGTPFIAGQTLEDNMSGVNITITTGGNL